VRQQRKLLFRDPKTSIEMGSDYLIRFAQTMVQILMLLVLVLLIGRYPDFVKTVSVVGVDVRIQRTGEPTVSGMRGQCQ
jgi:hypothetical protein